MDQDAQEIYDHLEKELIRLHYNWQMFRQLYGNSAESVKILNGIAPDVFAVMQDALWNQIVLTLGKINDTPTTGRHENISIENLINRIDETQHPELKDELNDDLKKLRALAQKIETDRNKRIAHFDKVYLFDSEKGGVSRADVEAVLDQLRTMMNKIKLRFKGSQVIHHLNIHHHGDLLIRYFQTCGTAKEINEKRVEMNKHKKFDQA
jgi:hypothetical protein